MSATLDRALALCEVLASHAEQLGELRRSSPRGLAEAATHPENGTLWGGTLGAAAQAGSERAWYHALDAPYRELDHIIRTASPALCDSVLCHPRVRALQSRLHHLRAAYEYDREVAQARAVLACADASRLRRLLERESYWALGPELRRALSGAEKVLVLGSGPLPLSALAIAAAMGARVTCVDHDAQSVHLGTRVIAASGHADSMRSIEADVTDLEDLERYDAVLGVVLLGVDIHEHAASAKTAIARHVIARLRRGASLVLRDPHGLGRLLYPPADLEGTHDVEVTRWLPDAGSDQPYRSALLVASRLHTEEIEARCRAC